MRKSLDLLRRVYCACSATARSGDQDICPAALSFSVGGSERHCQENKHAPSPQRGHELRLACGSTVPLDSSGGMLPLPFGHEIRYEGGRTRAEIHGLLPLQQSMSVLRSGDGGHEVWLANGSTVYLDSGGIEFRNWGHEALSGVEQMMPEIHGIWCTPLWQHRLQCLPWPQAMRLMGLVMDGGGSKERCGCVLSS